MSIRRIPVSMIVASDGISEEVCRYINSLKVEEYSPVGFKGATHSLSSGSLDCGMMEVQRKASPIYRSNLSS